MKFGLLGPTAPFRGGISHYTTLLARALAARGPVTFVSYKRQYPSFLFPGTTQLDRSGEPITTPNDPAFDPLWPLSWFRSADRLARAAPDLVVVAWWHPFFGPGVAACLQALARRRIRTVLLCHNVAPHEASPVDRVLTSLAFRFAGGFLTHAIADAAVLAARYPNRPVVCFPHPTYAPLLAGPQPEMAEARRQLGVTSERVLLFFGLVRPYKGLADLLAAMALIEPGTSLVVAGEAYESTAPYRSQIDGLGLASRVLWLDRYIANEELPRLFAAADLVVCPYRSGSQSGVVQLAYGAGRPVLVTRVGGLADVVEDGATGLVVPPQSPEAIAEAVRAFYAAGGLAAFGPRVAAHRDRYGWDALVKTLEGMACPP